MNVRWSWLVVVATACRETPPPPALIDYAVNLTGAPVCPDGQRPYNRLRTTLLVQVIEPEHQVGSVHHDEHELGLLIYSGVAEPGPNKAFLSGAKSVLLRFRVCPIKDDPEGRGALNILCEREAARVYAERTAVLDPAKLLRWSLSPSEVRASGALPWPSPELECWEGRATAWPTPL